MSEINFFKDFTEAATITEDGELLRGGKSTSQIILECNESAHIPNRFGKVRFSDYPDIIWNKKDGTSENITQNFKAFCLSKKCDKVFGLSGTIGSGKTTLACAGMHERAINGLAPGLYLSCRTLKPMIMTSRSFKASESEMDIYNKYATTPFLVLDEVGKCTDSTLEWDFVTTIFALRYDAELPTVFTTNLNYEQFRVFIMSDLNRGADIYDRLKTTMIPEIIVSESHRGKNETNR